MKHQSPAVWIIWKDMEHSSDSKSKSCSNSITTKQQRNTHFSWPRYGGLLIHGAYPKSSKSFIDDHFKLYLVGGFNPSEKYESQLGWLFPYIMENKKCLKPPTRYSETHGDLKISHDLRTPNCSLSSMPAIRQVLCRSPFPRARKRSVAISGTWIGGTYHILPYIRSIYVRGYTFKMSTMDIFVRYNVLTVPQSTRPDLSRPLQSWFSLVPGPDSFHSALWNRGLINTIMCKVVPP